MQYNKGYAAITATIFILVVSLVIISAFTFFTLQEVRTNRAYVESIDSHYVSESGIEDAAYRILAQKLIGASQTLGVGDGTTTVTVTTSGSSRTIRSEGVRNAFQKNLETTIAVTSSGVSFHYGVLVGAGGITMANGAQVNGNVYSNGSITGGTITGDATVAGGINTNPEVQWINNTVDQFFATSTASRDIAQSFTATSTGPIPKVSVLISKVGSPSSDITLHITTDDSGKPNRTDIANTIIKNSVVASSVGWVDVAFSSPPNVTNGTTYWIVLDYGSNSTTNYWNWRKDASDGYASNTGKYANDWSSPSATWVDTNGDLAFKVWIGGTNTKIDNVTIGTASSGSGRANLFVNDIIHGSACPNVYCIVENPPSEIMPISDGLIQDWKDAAQSGGVCAPPVCDSSGNLNVSGTKTLGPLKIPGNITFDNNAILIVNGTLWVQGNMSLSNNCSISLASSYGSLSGVIVTNGTVDISNNCTFAGSGTSGSFIMILSDKNDPPGKVMDISNNSSGVIYYAARGRIHLSNNAAAKEITAYGLDLDNNATVTYDSGLASTNFSSGPSGGYEVNQWHEVQ
ncbi:MAG: hypothetical protein AAB975_02865 [Patescibacteria group bacterium]